MSTFFFFQTSHVYRNSLITTSVSAQDVKQYPGVVQRFAAVVPLHHRNHIGRPFSFVLESTELERAEKAESNGRGGIGKLLLDELERRKRSLELVSVKGENIQSPFSYLDNNMRNSRLAVQEHNPWPGRDSPPKHPSHPS